MGEMKHAGNSVEFPKAENTAGSLILVTNFFEELRQVVPE